MPVNKISTSQLVERAVQNILDTKMQKRASNIPEPDGGTKATLTSFGQQQTSDLLDQGPNAGKLPDGINSIPQKADVNEDLPDGDIVTALEPAGEATTAVTDPQNDPSQEGVSEKLALKKDAAALIAKVASINQLGQQILDYMMSMTVKKTASIAEDGIYNQDQILRDIQGNNNKVAAVPNKTVNQTNNKVAAVPNKTVNQTNNKVAAVPNKTVNQTTKKTAANILQTLKAKTAANKEENAMALIKKSAAAIIESALYAANLTANRVRDLDAQNKQADGEEVLPIPEEDANAMLSQSLESQGVDPGVVEGLPVEGEIPQEGLPQEGGIDPAQVEQLESLIQELNANGVSDEEIEQAVAELVEEGALGGDAGGEAAVDPAALGAEEVDPATFGADTGIDPEQAAELESAIQELSAQGVSDEEILEAVTALAEEEEAGVDPAAAAVADAEVAKTGQYKSASFSANGTVKSAEQEKRSACVRGAMRDFLYLRNGTYNPASLTPSVWS